MKILFTADLHIKIGQKGVPPAWQENRYNLLFNKLKDIAKSCDAIIIGGDIFDKVPNMEELSLYFHMLSILKDHKVLIYSGNHEAVKKSTTFLTALKSITSNSTNGNISIIDDYYEDQDFIIVPYNKLKDFVANPFYSRKICFTHVRGEIPPHVVPEVNLDVFNDFEIVFAGDLHSHSNCQRNIVYPGSPVTTSFHRKLTDSGVVVVDTTDESFQYIPLDLPQLLRVRVDSMDDVKPSEYHHTVYELEGDISKLSNVVQTNELLDKKVLKRESLSTLALKDMTIQEELAEYLSKILSLDKETIEQVIKTYNDNSTIS